MNDDQQLAYGDMVNVSPEYEAWYRNEYPGYVFFGHDAKPEGWTVSMIDDIGITVKQGCILCLRVPRRFVSKRGNK